MENFSGLCPDTSSFTLGALAICIFYAHGDLLCGCFYVSRIYTRLSKQPKFWQPALVGRQPGGKGNEDGLRSMVGWSSSLASILLCDQGQGTCPC